MIKLLTEVELLRVEPDQRARIIIDERSGIIVMGKDVRVSTVAIAQGNLTVTISESPLVSQPQPFSNGATAVIPRTNINVDALGRCVALAGAGLHLEPPGVHIAGFAHRFAHLDA